MYHEIKTTYPCLDIYTVLFLARSVSHPPELQKISPVYFVHYDILKPYQNVQHM